MAGAGQVQGRCRAGAGHVHIPLDAGNLLAREEVISANALLPLAVHVHDAEILTPEGPHPHDFVGTK